MDDLARLLNATPTSRAGHTSAPATMRDALVTKSDTATGNVWVTPVDGDGRIPLGPCRAARRDVLASTGDGGYVLARQVLPVGTRVLVAVLPSGTWILAVD